MNDHFPFRDPSLQRPVPDFEARADLRQKRVDRDLRRVPHEMLPATEMEYTTEWQIESAVEAAHCA